MSGPYLDQKYCKEENDAQSLKQTIANLQGF